jgi:hypothetical protein
MAQSGNINLLKSETGPQPLLVQFGERWRLASYLGLILVVMMGLVTAGAYFFFKTQKEALEDSRMRLISRLNAQKDKEGFLLTLHERLSLIEKALAAQLPWAQVLETTGQIALPPKLTSISVDVDKDSRVTLTVVAESLEEALGMTNALLTSVAQKRARVPELVVLQVDKDGSVQISLAFIPIFERL